MNSFINPSTGFLEECPQPFILDLSNSYERNVESNIAVSCKGNLDHLPTSVNQEEMKNFPKCNVEKSTVLAEKQTNPKVNLSEPSVENLTNYSTICTDKSLNYLIGKWDLYYHLPYVKEWDITSYTVIMKNIDTVENLIAINKHTPDLIIKQCMLFVMRSGITPRWEDPRNKNGGCFSFKVVNKFVTSVWKLLFYSLCGETIFEKPIYNSFVTGITISPKKNFCIIKIWMENCSIQDPNLIVQIPNLIKQGCLFNKHDMNK
jgi:hypothetical protein